MIHLFGEQAARLCLTIGEIPFEDMRLSPEIAKEKKKTTPFGRYPILTIDGETVSHKMAILRYCARISGLYPYDDQILSCRIDSFAETVFDASQAIARLRDDSVSISEETRRQILQVDLTRYLDGLEKLARKNNETTTWVVGEDISMADVSLYALFGEILHPSFDDLPTDICAQYTRLMAAYDGVATHPAVEKWQKAHG